MRQLGMRPRVPVPHDFICDPNNVRRMIVEKNALVFTYVHPDDPLKQIDVFLTPEMSDSALVIGSVTRLIYGTQCVLHQCAARCKLVTDVVAVLVVTQSLRSRISAILAN